MYTCTRQLVIPRKLVLQGDSERTWHAAEIEQYAAPLRRRFQRWRSCKAGKNNAINDIIRGQVSKTAPWTVVVGMFLTGCREPFILIFFLGAIAVKGL